MIVSSQRTMVVVPSAPASRSKTPPPLNVPSWVSANRVGGSNSVIVDRVRDGDPEDPDRRLARRPDADRAVAVQPDGLHVVHPARLALDVGEDVPDALDRRVDDDDRADRLGRPALRGLRQEAVDGVPDARTDHPEPDQAADHRITVRQVVTPAADHLVDGLVPVGRLEVDGGDRVRQDRRLEPEPLRIEGGRIDAVVRREPDDDDSLDRRRRAAARSSSVGVVSPVTGSRVVKPGVAVLAVDALADPRRIVGECQVRVEGRAPGVGDAVDRPDPAVLREMRRRPPGASPGSRPRSRRCSWPSRSRR